MLASLLRWSLLTIISLQLSGCASDQKINASLSHVNQNAIHYAELPASNYTLSASYQKQLSKQFLRRYFSPWHKNDLYHLYEPAEEILKEQKSLAKMYLHCPGWGANLRPNSQTWIKTIVNNMDLTHFPNDNQPAIMVTGAEVRQLPTADPSYDTPDQPGFSYPFDELQESYLAINTPVRILQKSLDGVWVLIATPSYAGWVPQTSVAIVDKKFIQSWESQNFVTANIDHAPIQDSHHQTLAQTRMGVLYPVEKDKQQQLLISMAFKNLKNSEAIILKGQASSKVLLPFPAPFTPVAFAELANAVMGNPYGWGGYHGYRDCSATQQDLFAAFGIWLPRSSTEQGKMGEYISLKNMKKQQKLDLLRQQGIPFLTLVHLSGHIMLYIGDDQGTLYVFHSPWGLKTSRWFRPDGRIVIGRAVITPLSFGHGYWNISKDWLDRANGLVLLAPHSVIVNHSS